MAPAKILLMAAARKAGITDYKSMTEDELRAAIKSAKSGTATPAPAKGKAAPAKGKAAPAAKGKPTPAKGKATPAKATPRKTTARKSAPAKSTVKKSTPAKGKASQGAQAKRPTAARSRSKAVVSGTRAAIGKIKWNVETNVGLTGKRKDVLDALREFKGDKDAAFKKLKRKAAKFYPDGGSLGDSEKMLRWLIGRVAYDYAYKSGQHESADRVGYGTSTRAADVKRREQRAAAHKPTRSRMTARKTAAARKTAPAKGKPRAAAGRKTAARKGR